LLAVEIDEVIGGGTIDSGVGVKLLKILLFLGNF
jgi:hypothetical protein